MLVRTLQADLRGVVGAAPYRVCANIVGKHLVFPQGRPLVARAPTKTNFRRGGVSPPACRNFYLASRRRTSEPALCKGRCRAPRGGGVVPDRNYFSFLLCKLSAFTIPQALPRQLPLLGGAFGLCEHCKLTCGASWAPPPTGFVRTLRVRTLPTVGATIGRPTSRQNPTP